MKNPSDPREPKPDSSAHARQQWTKPRIVVYGHLAKLTRAGSGMYSDGAGTGKFQKSMCL